jgi:hypothetical protein
MVPAVAGRGEAGPNRSTLEVPPRSSPAATELRFMESLHIQRIDAPGAQEPGGHGWATPQAELQRSRFADACRRLGRDASPHLEVPGNPPACSTSRSRSACATAGLRSERLADRRSGSHRPGRNTGGSHPCQRVRAWLG